MNSLKQALTKSLKFSGYTEYSLRTLTTFLILSLSYLATHSIANSNANSDTNSNTNLTQASQAENKTQQSKTPTVSLATSPTASLTATEIVQKMQDNFNAKTATITFAMHIQTKRSKRNIQLESFSIGEKKSFIKITYPKKDQGITFLKLDRSMWQYIPRIERIIKIPSSMMLQSWMGSDFTNEDLVRGDSMVSDYQHTLLQENDQTYQLQLTPNESAAVVWGKIVMWVSKQYLLPTQVEYFDEEGALVRLLEYHNIKSFGEYHYPTLWKMKPQTEDKQHNITIIEILTATFNQPVNKSYFTKRALKRFSD